MPRRDRSGECKVRGMARFRPANHRPVVVYSAVSNALSVRGPERYHLGLLPALAALPRGYDLLVISAPWQSYYAALNAVPGLRHVVVVPPYGRVPRGLWNLL